MWVEKKAFIQYWAPDFAEIINFITSELNSNLTKSNGLKLLKIICKITWALKSSFSGTSCLTTYAVQKKSFTMYHVVTFIFFVCSSNNIRYNIITMTEIITIIII